MLLLPMPVPRLIYLINDDTYQWDCATTVVSFFGQIEQSAHITKEILDFLNKESVSGAHSGRASL